MLTNTIVDKKTAVKAVVVYLTDKRRWAAFGPNGEPLGIWPGLPGGWRAAALAALRHSNRQLYEVTLSAVFSHMAEADKLIEEALAKLNDDTAAMWHQIEQHLEHDRLLRPRYFFVVATKKYGRNQTSNAGNDRVLWYYQAGQRHEPGPAGRLVFLDFLKYLDDNDLVLAPGNEGMEVREGMVIRRYIKRGA